MIRKSLAVCLFFASLCFQANAVTNTTIVATKSQTSVSSDQKNVTLFTPTATGQYRISEYITGSSTSKAVQSFESWVDEFRTEVTGQNSGASPALLNLSSGSNFAYNTVVVHAVSGHAIQYSLCIGASGGCTSQTMTGSFDVFFVVEKLF